MTDVTHGKLVYKDSNNNAGTIIGLSENDINKMNAKATLDVASSASASLSNKHGELYPATDRLTAPVSHTDLPAAAKLIWTGYNNYADDESSDQIKIQHDHTFRGSNLLGSGHFASLDALSRALAAGDFSDIYIGDYIDAPFSYGGTSYTARCRVAGIDYYMNYGDTDLITRHHLAMVPDSTIAARMNSTDTTDGGYAGSEMYTTTLPALMNALGGAGGTPFYGHLLPFRELLSNAISTASGTHPAMHPGSTGWAENWAWYTVSGVLMSEQQIYGSTLAASSVWAQGNTKPLPLFNLVPEYMFSTPTAARYSHWLRSVVFDRAFCIAADDGVGVGYGSSANVFGLRPLFVII
jgi:hypothetical protein